MFTRQEAIDRVFTLTFQVEMEFGYNSRLPAAQEAEQILLALGVTPEEIAPHMKDTT